jgi:hypothetical protein
MPIDAASLQETLDAHPEPVRRALSKNDRLNPGDDKMAQSSLWPLGVGSAIVRLLALVRTLTPLDNSTHMPKPAMSPQRFIACRDGPTLTASALGRIAWLTGTLWMVRATISTLTDV